MEDYQKKLVAQAREIRNKAYAPYSHFRVGAALLAESGRVYTGCNIENSSYGAAICAERGAVSAAVAAGDRIFKAIAIAAGDDEILPCGICRQVLAEFSPDIEVICASKDGFSVYTLSDLLPRAFTKFKAEE